MDANPARGKVMQGCQQGEGFFAEELTVYPPVKL